MMSRLEQLKQEYQDIRPSYWNEETRNRLIEDFTYHSTKIEGLKLNYGDTMRFLRTGLVKSNTSPKDIADLKNHREVLGKIFHEFDHLELSNESICDLHGTLMKDRIQWGTYDPILGLAGEFKLENNYGTRKGEMKEYMDPSLVKQSLKRLCELTNDKLQDPSQVVGAINEFHYQFLNTIHPFSDGNGRMARMIHNLLLLKNGYPVVIIDSGKKTSYIDAIIAHEKDPSSGAFHQFMDEHLENALNKAISTHKKNLDKGLSM